MTEHTKKAIATAQEFLTRDDPATAAFVLRDIPTVEELGLKDYAWSMCRDDSYVHENDVKFLIDKIMEKG
jgi:hypothetical protein